MEILNIFNIGGRLTIMKLVVESSNSSVDSSTDQANVTVWVWGLNCLLQIFHTCLDSQAYVLCSFCMGLSINDIMPEGQGICFA